MQSWSSLTDYCAFRLLSTLQTTFTCHQAYDIFVTKQGKSLDNIQLCVRYNLRLYFANFVIQTIQLSYCSWLSFSLTLHHSDLIHRGDGSVAWVDFNLVESSLTSFNSIFPLLLLNCQTAFLLYMISIYHPNYSFFCRHIWLGEYRSYVAMRHHSNLFAVL